jgi:hypothetical protein
MTLSARVIKSTVAEDLPGSNVDLSPVNVRTKRLVNGSDCEELGSDSRYIHPWSGSRIEFLCEARPNQLTANKIQIGHWIKNVEL